MEKKVTPYKESQLNKKQQVEQMFDTISSNYDGLNRVISLGSDIKWRKKVIDLVAEKKTAKHSRHRYRNWGFSHSVCSRNQSLKNCWA